MHLRFVETEQQWLKLLPLTYLKPTASLRVGILTIAEKWFRRLSAASYGYETQAHLHDLFSLAEDDEATLKINGNILPNDDLIERVGNAGDHTSFHSSDGVWIASYGKGTDVVTIDQPMDRIERPWDIFRYTRAEIEKDFDFLTRGRKSNELTDPHTVVYGTRLFVEDGVSVRAAVLDTESGPIYLDRNSQIHEGALVKGALYLGEGSHLNMGAKLKGDSSIGPYSKVGGEVSNSAIQGFSNKGHEGFLGNSVLGEWCNLGADTNNSNLKNNYAEVKMWDYERQGFVSSGLQFCGLIMGDHSKSGINSMFNTGTSVGLSANLFGSGFPRTVIPSFSWGGASGFSTYQLKKALETAELVMSRRNHSVTPPLEKAFEHVFRTTANQRIWEKK